MVAEIKIPTIADRTNVTSEEERVNLGEDLVDSDGGEAFFLLDDAGLEAAAPAVGLVVEDAMLFAVGEPDAGLVAGGEDGDAWRLDGGGEVHGAAVMADEDAGVGEDGGALARGQGGRRD